MNPNPNDPFSSTHICPNREKTRPNFEEEYLAGPVSRIPSEHAYEPKSELWNWRSEDIRIAATSLGESHKCLLCGEGYYGDSWKHKCPKKICHECGREYSGDYHFCNLKLDYITSEKAFEGKYDVYEKGLRNLQEAYDHDIKALGRTNTLKLYDRSLDYRSRFETYPIRFGSCAGELAVTSALEAALCKSHRIERVTSSFATGLVSNVLSSMPGAMVGLATQGEFPEAELAIGGSVGAVIAFSIGGPIAGLLALGSSLVHYVLAKRKRY